MRLKMHGVVMRTVGQCLTLLDLFWCEPGRLRRKGPPSAAHTFTRPGVQHVLHRNCTVNALGTHLKGTLNAPVYPQCMVGAP